MGNVKYRPLAPLSEWIEYRLVTDLLDPPVLKLRLKPITFYSLVDSVGEDGTFKYGKATEEAVIGAVAGWDLDHGGVPIPCTEENKAGWLRPLLAEKVEGGGAGDLLAVAIFRDANDRERFLKN